MKNIYRMNRIAYHLSERLTAIELCFAQDCVLSGLTLLYSGIDSAAWLFSPRSQLDVKRFDFVQWCDKYMIPGSDLPCSGVDLYAARCALLHTYTARSKLSREGKAKKLFYAHGEIQLNQHINDMTDEARRTSYLVHVSSLLAAFRNGVAGFFSDIAVDPALCERVTIRAKTALLPYTRD